MILVVPKGPLLVISPYKFNPPLKKDWCLNLQLFLHTLVNFPVSSFNKSFTWYKISEAFISFNLVDFNADKTLTYPILLWSLSYINYLCISNWVKANTPSLDRKYLVTYSHSNSTLEAWEFWFGEVPPQIRFHSHKGKFVVNLESLCALFPLKLGDADCFRSKSMSLSITLSMGYPYKLVFDASFLIL